MSRRHCFALILPYLWLWQSYCPVFMLVIIVTHTLHSWVMMFWLFSTATYIAPSSTVKATQHQRDFLVSTNLIFPFPVTKVCGTLSNMVFSSPLALTGHNIQAWPQEGRQDQIWVRPKADLSFREYDRKWHLGGCVRGQLVYSEGPRDIYILGRMD